MKIKLQIQKRYIEINEISYKEHNDDKSTLIYYQDSERENEQILLLDKWLSIPEICDNFYKDFWRK